MSGTGANIPQFVPQIPGVTPRQFAALVAAIQVRQRLSNAWTAIADQARDRSRPARNAVTNNYNATVQFIEDTAQPSVKLGIVNRFNLRF